MAIDLELESYSGEVEPSSVYPFAELQHIEDGITARADDEVNVHGRQDGSEEASSWDISTLLISKGIANA